MDGSTSDSRGRDDSSTNNNLSKNGHGVKSLIPIAKAVLGKGVEKIQRVHENNLNDQKQREEQKAKRDEAELKEIMEYMKEKQERSN